ncbi:hypothetical protein [Kitasatospora sp. NPDC093102]
MGERVERVQVSRVESNALGFALCALLAWRRLAADRPRTTTPVKTPETAR